MSDINNISAPWEESALGLRSLDSRNLKLASGLQNNGAANTTGCYESSYSWMKFTIAEADSDGLPYEWTKTLHKAPPPQSQRDESEIRDLIEKDKRELLSHIGRIEFLYKRKETYFEEGPRKLKVSKPGASVAALSRAAQKGEPDRSVNILKEAVEAIKNDGLSPDIFSSISLFYRDADFGKAARIWREFEHMNSLNTLKNFKALNGCFYYSISYKGKDREVRIYVNKTFYAKKH